jgi:16S rRNA C967 or C1407 C5-methylase (RsmB/RsmF family)/NOL1/NOP2/fmu family ribosome biogenesis protein
MGTFDSPIPGEFESRMRKLYPLHADAYFAALSQPPPISIRMNAGKDDGAGLIAIDSEPVPWEKRAYYLSERPIFTLDPRFHAGQYYVQEASSMMIGEVAAQIIQKIDASRDGKSLKSQTKLRVLDLCGSPGGKSTHLADKLLSDDILVTNEVIRSRSNILTENMIKWGSDNVVVTCNDPEHFKSLGPWFDIMVVDAPCSGEGLFRKDPQAMKEWSTDAVEHCALRQNRIVDAIFPVLKPGGYLIYSTCTFNSEENDAQVNRLMESEEVDSVKINTENMPGVIVDEIPGSGATMYRCIPGLVRGEGLTFSVFKKKAQAAVSYPDTNYKSKNVLVRVQAPDHAQFLTEPTSYEFLQNKLAVFAVPKSLVKDVLELDQTLNIIHLGVEMGAENRPAHALSMSRHLNRGTFPEVELDKKLALEYLRRETIRYASTENGIVLLTFEGFPLGFGKLTQGRINNHYPMEWRIRMRE